MCNVPSTGVFVENLLNAFLVLFTDIIIIIIIIIITFVTEQRDGLTNLQTQLCNMVPQKEIQSFGTLMLSSGMQEHEITICRKSRPNLCIPVMCV